RSRCVSVLSVARRPRSPLVPYPTLFRSRRSAWSTPSTADAAPRRRLQSRPDVARDEYATTPWRSASEAARAVARSSSSPAASARSEEHTSELQSRENLVCRLLLEKKKQQ